MGYDVTAHWPKHVPDDLGMPLYDDDLYDHEVAGFTMSLDCPEAKIFFDLLCAPHGGGYGRPYPRSTIEMALKEVCERWLRNENTLGFVAFFATILESLHHERQFIYIYTG